ncbi:FecR domain-containing protein [Methylobacillus arboreus]|uniref:FecR domain-containing protein n=1 Tax=Methylobacillus arboreus TaxID=755170 RepID=UPI001E501D7E|nr:FecR domain-containing protein [Methylobacillus arboreus]MCB5190950.1 FecR domain-containing protein [Methylobacillus arboreus]
MGAKSEKAISPKVSRAAAEWLVELQSGQVNADVHERWQAWRAAHPDHERAWQHIEMLGEKLGGLSSSLAHATLAPRGSLKRRRAIKTLAMLLFAGGSAWAVQDKAPWWQLSADYSTGVGEQRRVVLEDGTTVELNSSSAINVAYTSQQRIVMLLRGEIHVTTAHESSQSRPFLVASDQGSMLALGTEFAVRQLANDKDGPIKIGVWQGAVEVSPSEMAARVRLQAGEQLSFTKHMMTPVEPVSRHDTAWLQRMLVADEMPLGEFLAELARYRKGSLGCDDSIKHLKVSGTYPLDDTDKVIDMLQQGLQLEVRMLTRYWVRLMPAST